MNELELIELTRKYFGRDRTALREALKTFDVSNQKIKKFKKIIRSCTSQPFFITEGLNDCVRENIINKNFNEIEMNDLGDLSWNIEILLNDNIHTGYDWDKNLSIKCGGKAKILQILINSIIPAYTINKYYISYSKHENYYEFGKIVSLEDNESKIINKIKQEFKKLNIFYVSKQLANKKFEDLISDCNSEGNASIFDCLFSDIYNYNNNIHRFNDKQIINHAGASVSWHEYYNLSEKLIYKEEWISYKSKDTLCIITDKNGQIKKLNLWRDFEDEKHSKISYNINKAYKLKRKKYVSNPITSL